MKGRALRWEENLMRSTVGSGSIVFVGKDFGSYSEVRQAIRSCSALRVT